MRFFDRSLARFVVVGAFNTALTYVAYLLLLRSAGYRIAFTVAFALGVLASYALNARYVFERRLAWRSLLRFPLVCVAQYLVGIALVSACVEVFGIPAIVAPVLAIIVTTPLTYVMSRAVFVAGAPR